MYYTNEELDGFDNKRTEIEKCAARLRLAAGGVGYNIIHQTGISIFGVQVNLMHRQGTPSGPPLVTTPAIASSAIPASQAVQSDSTSPPEPSYPTLRMLHRCVLEKARTERIDGFMARSVAFSKSFKDDADNAFDRETYKRGGQAMRVHFEECGAQASYSADVMVCDASTCYSDCAILPGVQLLPPLATGGQPFVHSIRDCFKPSNGELEFQPLETDNYAFFDKVPELEHGVPVCFDIDASGSKVQVLTTVCRWDKCETCKLFLCDDDIARLEENKENDGITEEKGNALARPRSKREDQEYQHDIDQGETWGYANETGWDNGSGWNNGSGWADGSAWGNRSAWDYGSVIEPPFDYTALVKRFARSTSTDGLEGLIEHVSSMDPDLAEATLRSLNMQPSEEDDRLEDGGLEDCLSCDVKKGKEK
ncbi:uncharacterized protein RCC_08831 [Ramularia collo-cygni]|uniref:Uncharacterized protein n=1 Tax=Ramularia collo-cygni TaxID=112498 RepID=A0A2D3VG64_9PEZI|nr:uncharacterized protein RCC_08831 [Ramularia collo-cygni]CZT23121.1 uncharacterized protein RCC_08831 [Ramularia collo-cygni]